MIARTWNVYGLPGHRIATAFNPSQRWEFAPDRIIEIRNADTTGSYNYTQICIICKSAAACSKELHGQLTDGLFENVRYGKVELVSTEKR